MDFLKTLEDILGKKANFVESSRAQGDVLNTAADVSALEAEFGFRPKIEIREGLERFVSWYKDYYKVGI
jgi:UDP-glucuronate 4-epimerase